MKVTCQLCGTKFEIKKNDYRCPECAAYYHVEGMPETYAKESTNQESQYNINQSDHSCGALFDKNKLAKAEKKGITGKVVLVIEIIILIMLVVLPFIGLRAGKERREQQRTKETVAVENISIENELVIGNTTIDLGQVKTVDTTGWNIPKGYQVIELKYETDTDYGKGATGNDAYYLAEIYLKTTEGIYISALNSYDVQELSGLSYDEVHDLQIINGFGYNEGTLYFLIRQDTFETFFIQEYEGDYEVRKLVREYVVTSEEVK